VATTPIVVFLQTLEASAPVLCLLLLLLCFTFTASMLTTVASAFNITATMSTCLICLREELPGVPVVSACEPPSLELGSAISPRAVDHRYCADNDRDLPAA